MDALSDLPCASCAFPAACSSNRTSARPGAFVRISCRGLWPWRQADGGLVAFHYVLDGRVQVRVGSEPPREAGPGDIILLSRNDPHVLGSDLAIPPVDARPLIRKAEEDLLACLDFGTGRQVKNRFICGFRGTAMRDHPLLTALPPPARGGPARPAVRRMGGHVLPATPPRNMPRAGPARRKCSRAWPKCSSSKPCGVTL